MVSRYLIYLIMNATIPFFTPIRQVSLSPGSKVTIPDISWQGFKLILQELGENLGKTTYTKKKISLISNAVLKPMVLLFLKKVINRKSDKLSFRFMVLFKYLQLN